MDNKEKRLDEAARECAEWELSRCDESDPDAAIAVVVRAKQRGGIHALATAAPSLCTAPNGKRWASSKAWEHEISRQLKFLPQLSSSDSFDAPWHRAVRNKLTKCDDLRRFWVRLLPALYRVSAPVNHEDLSGLVHAQATVMEKTQEDDFGNRRTKGFKPTQVTNAQLRFAESQKFLDPKKMLAAGYVDEPSGEQWKTAFMVTTGQESLELHERIELCKKLKIGAAEFVTERYSLAYLRCRDLDSQSTSTGAIQAIVCFDDLSALEGRDLLRRKTISLLQKEVQI